MEPMHSLLKRQLKRHFGDQLAIPAEWRAFLDTVNAAYREADADREMLEHSLELSSQEMLDANSEMRAVFEAIPDVVFRLDQQGTILDVKAGAPGDLMGRREDLIGKRIQNTPLQNVARQYSEAIQRVISENSQVKFEYSAVLQGQESHYEARLVPIPNQQMVVIIHNITERKQSLRLLGSAVEQTTESIVITDAELDLPGPRIIFVNPAFTKMTGYTAEEVLGQTPRILQGPKSDRAMLRRLREKLDRGETYTGETVNYRKDGTEFHIEWQVAPIRDTGGKITHFVGIQRDITERKQAEAALRDSEARYRALFDGSADGILIADVETKKFRYANRALCKMLGYTEAELCNLGVPDIHPPESLPQVVAEFEAQIRGDKTLAPALPCRRKDGSVFHADVNASLLEIDGRPCAVGFFRDITERKRAEKALLESEERFRQFTDQSSEAIWFAEVNPERILFVNRMVEKVWGLPAEHFYQDAGIWAKAIHPEDQARVHEAWAACIQGRVPRYEAEYRVVRPDGTIRWVLDGGMPMCNAAGDIVRMSGVAHDVTERKQAENALRMFQLASDNAADSIFWLDQNAGFYYVNDAACRSLGYLREELMSLNLFDIDPFISREQLEAKWQRSRDEKLDALRMESRHRRKDGSSFPIEVMAKHFDFDGTDLTLAFVRDMTEHKRTEADLAYERDLLRTLLDQSPDKIYFKDAQSRFIKAGKAHAREFGVASPEDLLGKTDFDFFTETHARPAFEDEQEIIRTGIPIIGKVEQEVWQDGRETWCLTTKMPFRDKDGQIVGTFGISKDITALKKIENALAYERDLFQMLMDQSPDSIYFKDLQSRFMRFSQAKVKRGFAAELARHTAAHPDEQEENRPAHLASEERFAEYLVGKTDFDLFAEAHARPAFEDEQDIIRTGVPVVGKVEKEIWLGGRETWVLTSKMPFRNNDGQIVGTFGVSKDITAMKEAEATLAREQARFRFVFENMPVGAALSHHYPDGRMERIINDAHLRICGLTREQDQLPGIYKQITHPEDAVRQTKFFRELDDNRSGSLSMEKRYVRLDGKTVWVTYFLQRQQHLDGSFDRLTMVVDITGLKEAEAQLRKKELLLSEAQRLGHIGSWFYDMTGPIAWSEEMYRIYGVSPDTFIPTLENFLNLIHPDDRPAMQAWIAACAAGEQPRELEFRVNRPDGTLHHIRGSGEAVFDVDKKLTYMAGMVVDITERKLAEEQLRQLSRAVEQSSASIVITDPAGNITYVNPKFSAVTGYSFAEALGKNPRILKSGETPAAAYAQLWQTITAGQEWHGEFHNKKKNGELYWETASISPIFDATGKITHFLAVKEDVTERKRMEEQLFQSQKMETVGKLAGGVAHEFNSILTAIIGQSELLIEDLPPGDPLALNATEIRKAADRAATLTRQLLAYGRKQFLRPEALNLNQVLASMDGMLRHLMGGETVEVKIIPAIGLHLVKADAGQIEQVIMNLALNARAAMPNGGKLTLETANVTFDAESVGRYPELKPGDYALLAITDTGTGMSPEVKARVFEPFFTTKDVGKGPGLGLSTCYGIIKQSGGHISVYSEPGRGTTFKIYLPQISTANPSAPPPPKSPTLPGGTETILLVEDDPALCEMAATLLRRLGYSVLTAANGVEALGVKQQSTTGHIDLLFTDVVMPHMSGKELADRVRALFPHTKILFTSAYTENASIQQGMLNAGMAFLQKPFTPSALACKVREVLDLPKP